MSDKREADSDGGLKTDYFGDPYDFYSLIAPTPAPTNAPTAAPTSARTSAVSYSGSRAEEVLGLCCLTNPGKLCDPPKAEAGRREKEKKR